MFLCHLLIFILTLHDLFSFVEPTTCSAGQRVVVDNKGKRKCEPCKDQFYQPQENSSKFCRPCTVCRHGKGWSSEFGSFVKVACTKTTDTQCQCLDGFVRYTAGICKCEKGSVISRTGDNTVCLKCKEGHFSTDSNIPCKKWKDCLSAGVKIPGTSISDVICNELNSGPEVTEATTSKTAAFSSNLTTHHSSEGAQIAHFTTTFTEPPQQKTKEQPHSHGNYLGLSLLLFGIAGLLMLTAVTCKLFITPCYTERSTQNQKECRIPVEESGSEESYKLNQEP